MNKHTRSVSLIDGHTEEMTEAEIELLHKTKQLIKSEAIKEFWKRFDKVLCENIGPSKRVYWKISSDGNNLVKEMTEVSE